MVLIIYILEWLALAASCFVLTEELLRDLMMMQQNSYRNERYSRWLEESKDSTSGWRLCGIIVLLLSLTTFCGRIPGMSLVTIFGIAAGVTLMMAKYKKPLVMTPRAKRLFIAEIAVCVVIILIAMLIAVIATHLSIDVLRYAVTATLGLYCLSHVVTLFANRLMAGREKRINDSFTDDARRILASMPGLKVVGITGSYGKTTTKHYLQTILSQQYETLMTPGSYNTPMGVVRTVRELLKPYHEVFICEMGAKNVGDIREICDIVHPYAGIITAVGPQHLESFRTIDNVRATKFELADALGADGAVVVNDDFEKIADRPVKNTTAIRYTVEGSEASDYHAENIKYSPEGTSFTIVGPEGWRMDVTTPVVGKANISNILAAVAMARFLGVEDRNISYALAHLPQVEHRLAIRRVPGGLTIIDDAFNSNPVGSSMALDVLEGMSSGKRYLVTPGMIELGDEEYELNRRFGEHAAKAADVVVVVGRYNRAAITEGLKDGGFPENATIIADSFAAAQAYITSHARPGDIVLYENDLPDTFK